MKSKNNPFLSFLSQPQRPFKDPSTADKQSPFLKLLLGGNTGHINYDRMLSNPGQTNYLQMINTPLRHSSNPEDAGQNENGWYHNYE